MTAQPGLCRTWSKTPKTGFLTTRHISDTETVGSIACADMLFRTNLIAMVGGGTAPRFDEKAVVIWDDSQGDPNKSVVMDITFAQPVTAVRLKKDR